jgi:hypothetical protein
MTDQPAAGDAEVPAWVRHLGITDRVTGLERAHASLGLLRVAGGQRLSALRPGAEYTAAQMAFSGFLARAQALHEAAFAAISTGNPYAPFTLLRAYAETAAVIFYLKDYPAQLDKLMPSPHGPGMKIGKITGYAARRLGGFQGMYGELSRCAHPAALSSPMAGHVASGQDEWASAPAFRSGPDALAACAWVVELAEVTSYLLVEFAAQHGLLADS